MAMNIGARLHALTHSLFKSKDEVEVRQLYAEVAQNFEHVEIRSNDDRSRIIRALSHSVCDEIELNTAGPAFDSVLDFIEQSLDFDAIWALPVFDPQKRRKTSEWWAIREELNRQKLLASEFDAVFDILSDYLTAVLKPLESLVLTSHPAGPFDLVVNTQLLGRERDLPHFIENFVRESSQPDLLEYGLLQRMRNQFECNLIEASGGSLDDPKTYYKSRVWPTKSQIKDPDELASTYLRGTPALGLLRQESPFVIPTSTRFEHTHIIGGSGHGKSQTLQYLIARDLPAVAAGERSIVVIDSQEDLIKNISQLEIFAPGGALHDRLVMIDPTDVEYPVALNLFDVGRERLSGYAPLERERLTNSILELYDFVLGSLLDAGMTQKQSVIFRYVTRLMLHIEDATIQTFRELMEEGSEEFFAEDIAKLSGTPKRFFETEFGDREFKQTRKQVLRRLWGILENQSFERMFSHPTSKLDLFHEMNAGKVILINTAKDLLKEQGTQIFGRFFIAMIAQAAQERATLPQSERTPTLVYVDEAADYFDRNIGLILSQARKYNVGMVLAHQYLGQLDPKLQDAFSANTSIKMAGGVSNKDARTLSSMFACSPDLIERQPKGSFAMFVRGSTRTAIPVSFPYRFLESMDRMTEEQNQAVRSQMRDRYAVHISELNTLSTDATDRGNADADPHSDDIDPTESW